MFSRNQNKMDNFYKANCPSDPHFWEMTQEDIDWYRNQIAFAKMHLEKYMKENRINGSAFEPSKPKEIFMRLGVHQAMSSYLFQINFQLGRAFSSVMLRANSTEPVDVIEYAPSIRANLKAFDSRICTDGLAFDQLK